MDLDEVYNKIMDLNPIMTPIKTSDHVEASFKVYNIYNAFPYDRWDDIYVVVYARVYRDGPIIAWLPEQLTEDEPPLMLCIVVEGDKYRVYPVTMKVVLDICRALGIETSIWNVKHSIPPYPHASKLIVLWTEKMDREWAAKYIISSNANIIAERYMPTRS